MCYCRAVAVINAERRSFLFCFTIAAASPDMLASWVLFVVFRPCVCCLGSCGPSFLVRAPLLLHEFHLAVAGSFERLCVGDHHVCVALFDVTVGASCRLGVL